MDEKGLAEAVLLGHSMGGRTAFACVTAAPERFPALVAVDISPEAGDDQRWIVDYLAWMRAVAGQPPAAADAALATHIPQAAVRAFLFKSYRRTPPHGWLMNLDALLASLPGLKLPPAAAYAGPALFVGGAESSYLPRRPVPGFPGAQLQHIAGAGHWVHAEQPAAFLAALTAFLAPLP